MATSFPFQTDEQLTFTFIDLFGDPNTRQNEGKRRHIKARKTTPVAIVLPEKFTGCLAGKSSEKYCF